MLDDIRENFAAALKRQGNSLNSTNPEELATAAAQLEAQKPLVKAYDSSTFAELLVSGDAWLVQGYSGQVGKAMNENPNIGYIIPKEGCTIWTDNICIPKDAPHADLALLFINFIMEAEIAGAKRNTTNLTVTDIDGNDLFRAGIQ